MINNIEEIVKKLKKDTNNLDDIVYREMYINKKKLYIIYNEPLTSSDKISDFVIRSLNKIKVFTNNLYKKIKNNISNFKVKEIVTYEDISFYLHKGFTIILIENEEKALALETKAAINRSVSEPSTESTIRGARDSFVEDIQTNLGLIKKRIKTNDFWIEKLNIGKYTNTSVGVLYINGIVKKDLVNEIKRKLKKINISGVVNSGTIKNLLSSEKIKFPTIITTERPDIVSEALLQGKVAILIDNAPYALIIPAFLNDFFKTMEDEYGKNTNVSFTRIIKVLAFIISITTPAIYISLITYNQEMIPTDLLVSFAAQRDGVPFPAFIEALMMIIAFEILREADLRVPSSAGSALSIVGALILGDAAVNAGIVSPIMIIVIAITAISSLPFTELEFVNTLRIYRLLFMLGAVFMGMIGVFVVFILFIIRLCSTESFGKPYLMPFVPLNKEGIKDSIIKISKKLISRRPEYLSNNTIEQRDEENEE